MAGVIFDGATVVGGIGEETGAALAIDTESGRIVDPARGARRVDAHGLLALPGFVDVHTHGGGGYRLHTTEPDEILAYARWAPTGGTTAFLITPVGVAAGLPLAQLTAAATAIERWQPGDGAEPLGIHLEGPFVNPARRGAHPADWLRLPCVAEAQALIEAARGRLRLVTLAPELPGAAGVMRAFLAAGVRVSIGHTDADYDTARDAIAHGASQLTHAFNAMPGLLHRAPGPLGAAIESERARAELIGDAVHVHPAAMRGLIRALGPERTVVITDAQPAAAVEPREDAHFDFAGQEAHVAGGVARLADGTIAGSIVTMAGALRNLVGPVGASLPEAATMLSRNPAEVAGAGERKGRLAPGYDADLLLFDQALRLHAAYCRARLAFATGDWTARLGSERLP